MSTPVIRRIALSILSMLLVSVGATVLRSQQKPASSRPDNGPAELSGKEMFKTYCATCHGEDARGHGPATAALKVAPPDLTLLRETQPRHVSRGLRERRHRPRHQHARAWQRVHADLGIRVCGAQRSAHRRRTGQSAERLS